MRVVEHPVAAPVPPRLHASATGFAAAGYSVDRCAAGHCRHFPVPCVLCRTRVPQAWLFTCALFCCQATRVACCQATPLRAVGAVFLYAALSLSERASRLSLCAAGLAVRATSPHASRLLRPIPRPAPALSSSPSHPDPALIDRFPSLQHAQTRAFCCWLHAPHSHLAPPPASSFGEP